ncbi:MAG: class I SAM-dependent methyltransferase [Myxococcota bacterium]
MSTEDDAALGARLFEVVHAGNPGDVAFYVEACRGARAILELGCGTGRLTAPLAEAGPSVVGVDLDPAKLDLARQAVPTRARGRVRLVHGDIRTLSLEDRFDRVVAPYNVLCALPSDEDVACCLSNAARHLSDDGLLLLDIYGVDEDLPEERATPGETDEEYLFTWMDGARRVDVFEREVLTDDPRRADVLYRYEVTDEATGEARRLEDRVPHLALPRSVLVRLLRRAGLEPVTEEGDFQGAPFDDESAHLVVRARPGRR